MAQKIFEAMASVMAEIEPVAKTQRNQQQGFNFRGIDQIYNSLQPLLAKNKIFTTPKILEVEREERSTPKGTVLFYSRIKMRYTFWTLDGSSVEAEVAGEGMDSGDKATNKAMAVAHKYALLQTFCIPTEDLIDPDSETHEVAPKSQSKPQHAPQPKSELAKILVDSVADHFKIPTKEAGAMIKNAGIVSTDHKAVADALNSFEEFIKTLSVSTKKASLDEV